MRIDKNDKKLDELICGVVSGNKPQFDFDKWKQEHKEQVEIFQSQKNSASVRFERNTSKTVLLRRVGYLAAALLVVSSWVVCFVLSTRVTDLKQELAQSRQNTAPAPADDSATINFYLEEHQDLVAQHASMSSTPPQPAQMHVSRQDVLYYESLDDGPDYMSPGIIVRGPSSPLHTGSPEAPIISNGHTLTLTEARKTADFELAAPARLYPGYALDQIRRIEGRDAIQLLYTDGIHSVSLFEQPLDGQRRLEPKDFREYAVYQNKGQAGGTILAWRDDALFYVLIGNAEMSRFMDMAQSISAAR